LTTKIVIKLMYFEKNNYFFFKFYEIFRRLRRKAKFIKKIGIGKRRDALGQHKTVWSTPKTKKNLPFVYNFLQMKNITKL